MADSGSKCDMADGTNYMDQLEMLKRSVCLDSCPKQSNHTVKIIELDKYEYVTQCMQCDQVYGVDDSIGLDELLDMLGQGQFWCRTPCKECGNDDPNQILVKLVGRGEVMVYTLRCMPNVMYCIWNSKLKITLRTIIMLMRGKTLLQMMGKPMNQKSGMR